ncbi:MAG: surface polysaccharide polymerase [Xanthobacteraceae bacterium]
MNTARNTSDVSAAEPNCAQPIGPTLAPLVVLAAVLANFGLCFVNTNVFKVNPSVVISCEIVLIAMAISLIWYRGAVLYIVFAALSVYFFSLMLVRTDFDPKIIRDLLIPFAFFFLGNYLGSLRSCDRLITVLILLTLGSALFELLALDTYLHYFDVIRYYVARGTTDPHVVAEGGLIIKGSGTAGLYVNGTRFQDRTLLPFLGSHRVSGIFLEPVSVGNFGAIAFAWVLLRDRGRIWPLVAKTVAIAIILVLADARFGFYFCIFTLVLYLAVPVIRPTILFLAPFLVMIGLVAYAGGHWQEAPSSELAGRLMSAADSLVALDPWEVLGLRINDGFINSYSGDSGYGYVLGKVGLVGLIAIWALFVYAPVFDRDAWRFKVFVAFYAVSLLCISASLFTIKTAALLWFLHGTLNSHARNHTRETTGATFRSLSSASP